MQLNYKITALLDGNKLDEFVTDCRSALITPDFTINCGEDKDVEVIVFGGVNSDSDELNEFDKFVALEELRYFFHCEGWENSEYKIEAND